MIFSNTLVVCIMILSAFPNQMNYMYVDFMKTGLSAKIPNITALSNISFATILNIFAKQKSFLLSYLSLCLDKKASEWYDRSKNVQEQNYQKYL